MRVIYRIARTELSLLFYSPIAWFVLIIFTFQSGLIFTDSLKAWLQMEQSMGNYRIIQWGGLTQIIFAQDGGGFYGKVQGTLFLYIPLLTMSLLSRETSSGSIKLLMSSPIKIGQIVLGKFISIMVYCFFFILTIFLYILTAKWSIVSMDFSMAMTGLLGTYLLICTYGAIGLFMSSLTSYQMIAAVSTFVTLAGLNYIGRIGQNFGLVRTITYFVSLGSQTQNLNRGLISSADLIYFILITGLFLLFTVMRLSDARSLRSKVSKSLRYALVVTVFMVFEFIFSKPQFTFYHDATANKNQTLSPNTQAVIRELQSPLKITAYTNLLDDHVKFGLPENWNNDKRFWEFFTRFLPAIDFKYVYFYDTSEYNGFLVKENEGLSMRQVAEKTADAYGYNISMFLQPTEIKKQINLKSEENRFVRLLESGNRKTYLRSFNDYIDQGQPTEYEIVAALNHLVNSPSKIVFITGGFERSIFKNDPQGYSSATLVPGSRSSMINQGFELDTVSLSNQEIPKETSVLVLADPKVPISSNEMQKIERHLANGGNMVIAGEAGRQELLNPLLSKLGVRLMDGKLVQSSNHTNAPDFIGGKFTKIARDLFDTSKLKGYYGQNRLVSIALSNAVGLEYKTSGDFHIEPVLVTDSTDTWNKRQSFSSDTSQLHFNPEQGDMRASIPVAFALTRKINGREQRIMILGDADFMNNELINYEGNMPFVVQMFKWLNYGKYPIDTDIKTFDNNFKIHLGDVPLIRTIFLGIIPIALGVYCLILLLYRKKK